MFRTLLLMMMVASQDAAGTTIAPYTSQNLRGLAHSSDLVITGKPVALTRGTRGGIKEDGTYVWGTDTRVSCAVTAVHFGEIATGSDKIEIVFTAADEPIQRATETSLLLFLKREDAAYRLVFYQTYGIFAIKDGNVRCWFEGHQHGEFLSLQSVLQKVEKFRQCQVVMSATVDEKASAAKGQLVVKYTFRNRGKSAALIIPPSYCFNAISSRKLDGEKWFPKQHPWKSVEHWSFLPEREPLRPLPPGETIIMKYEIPFSELGLGPGGSYLISVCYQPYRRSKWFDQKPEDDAQSNMWLGALDGTSRTVEIVE